jgi:hypothetical protein
MDQIVDTIQSHIPHRSMRAQSLTGLEFLMLFWATRTTTWCCIRNSAVFKIVLYSNQMMIRQAFQKGTHVELKGACKARHPG